MIVLDTNVLSELMRPRPEPRVLSWCNAQRASDLYTSTLSQAEILAGIAILPRGKRRSGLEEAARAMFEVDFHGRILGLSSSAAHAYADVIAVRRSAGRPIDAVDGLVAAVVRAADARLATRNTTDFEGCGLRLIDPWKA